MATKKTQRSSVGISEVVTEFISKMEEYLGQTADRKKRLSFLARKTNVHSKTISRILSRKNQPSLTTLMRIYRFLFNVDSDVKVLEKLPEASRQFLHSQFPDKSNQSNLKVTGAQHHFRENPIALELYLKAAGGVLNRNETIKRFGTYGEEMIDLLISESFISETNPGVFSTGQRSVDFSPEVVVKAGQICVQRFAKPQSGYELGRHFAGFYLESLSQEGFEKWMQLDKECFEKKIKLAQAPENKGPLPIFTFNIVETMSSEDV